MKASTRLAALDSHTKGTVPARRHWLKRLMRDTRGADFVEYLVLIAVVALVGGTIFGGFVTGMTGAGTQAAGKVANLFK